MSDLVTRLSEFGFTKTDSLIYMNLLKNGKSSGYKIAKEISLSRSSVYSSIDNLYKNGYVFMSDGDTKEYEAKSPELIFSQLEVKTIENINVLKKELSKMVLKEEKEFVYNITGIDNLIQKTKEVINQSQVEIYLNTDFRFENFSEEITDAIDRGVRVIVFSFNKIEVPQSGIELYTRSDKAEVDYPSHRFMIVVDMKQGLMFSHREESLGLYTNNRLLVKMIAEHIHSDIYLTEYEKQMPDKRHCIGTIHELGNEMVQDSLKKRYSKL